MALTMTLNGSNYVSDKTRGAFEYALQDAGGRRQETRMENQEWRMENGELRIEQPTTHNPQPATHNPQFFETLDHALAQSYEHQTLTMHVHEQYLNNQGDYARLFGQLMQQQGTIFAQAASIPQHVEMTAAVLETLSRSMARFHDLQEQTLDVHRQFLAQQSDYAHAAIQLLAGQRSGSVGEGESGRAGEWESEGSPKRGNGNGHHPQEAGSKRQEARIENRESPISQSPNLQSPNPPLSLSPSPSLTPSLLAIVSEKTGYPADMLELDMDMEADLGIDSIKRVEILGALQDAHPDLPEVSTDILAEMRTLRQIVERMQDAGSKNQESANQRISESANRRIGESANQQIFNHPILQSSKKA